MSSPIFSLSYYEREIPKRTFGSNSFYQIYMECPCCWFTLLYHDLENVVCDNCSEDIKLNGAYQTCMKRARRGLLD